MGRLGLLLTSRPSPIHHEQLVSESSLRAICVSL
jgi:hypothetical protein